MTTMGAVDYAYAHKIDLETLDYISTLEHEYCHQIAYDPNCRDLQSIQMEYGTDIMGGTCPNNFKDVTFLIAHGAQSQYTVTMVCLDGMTSNDVYEKVFAMQQNASDPWITIQYMEHSCDNVVSYETYKTSNTMVACPLLRTSGLL
eukprot:UN02325